MEIRNEEHAREMLAVWQKKTAQVQKKDILLAIQKLELSCMYYEQKGNSQGTTRCEKCILILNNHLATLA